MWGDSVPGASKTKQPLVFACWEAISGSSWGPPPQILFEFQSQLEALDKHGILTSASRASTFPTLIPQRGSCSGLWMAECRRLSCRVSEQPTEQNCLFFVSRRLKSVLGCKANLLLWRELGFLNLLILLIRNLDKTTSKFSSRCKVL